MVRHLACMGLQRVSVAIRDASLRSSEGQRGSAIESMNSPKNSVVIAGEATS
jgi:hypothetical protein